MPEQNSVVIVGAGLAGLCTAHYLTEQGFKVQIIEREIEVAKGASYANGGLLTPSMSEPWNAPGVLGQLIKYLGKSDAPMLLRPTAIPSYASWGIKFLKNATEKGYQHATLNNISLSLYSLKQQALIRDELDFSYNNASNGTMKVFRNQSTFDAARSNAQKLIDRGLRLEFMDSQSLVKKESTLESVADDLVGAIYYPDDETGDARLFCQKLTDSLISRGVVFHFETEVEKLAVENKKIKAVLTNKGRFNCQHAVVTGGAWSAQLLNNVGVKVAVKPVKGYSVSVPMSSTAALPKVAVVDDDMHAAITPLGSNIRLAGTAEFSGWQDKLDMSRIENLWQFFHAITPELASKADRKQSESWCGLRPMSADGLPYIGKTSIKGLFVNTGHGPLGWSQAAGSASLLSKIITNQNTELDMSVFAIERKN